MYNELERKIVRMIKNRDSRSRSQAKIQEHIEELISKEIEVK